MAAVATAVSIQDALKQEDVLQFLEECETAGYPEMSHVVKKSFKCHDHERTHCKLQLEQYCVNFPLLYLASIYLYAYAKRKGCTHFLFATRDCCHWINIFKRMFPDADAHYFNCSRVMLEKAAETQNAEYDAYVRGLTKGETDKTVFVDLHGTGRRMYRYFKIRHNAVPFCFLLTASKKLKKPQGTQTLTQLGKLRTLLDDVRGTPIEMLNYDLQGTLKDWVNGKAVRDPPEYSEKLIGKYHDHIRHICRQLQPFDVSKIPKSHQDAETLLRLIEKRCECIRANLPVVSRYIKHVANHDKLQ